MNSKRKSNWYIYLITLIASFVILGFFVSKIWDSLFPTENDSENAYSVNNTDYRPSADIKLTALVMLSEMKAGTPDYYMLANYRPRDEAIVFIPLPENLYVTYDRYSGSLYEMYSNLGAEAVMGGIKELTGIECDTYVKFDRLSFIDFVDLTGEVYVNIPVDITETRTETKLKVEVMEIDGELQEVTRQEKEEVEVVIFPGGTQYFDGETLYNYITYDFGKGRDYQLAIAGSAVMNMVNRNFRDLSSIELQGYTEKIISSTDTSFMFSDYVELQPVLQYTTDNSINPCEYYIPYGEENGGYFVLAENSAQTMRDRFKVELKDEDDKK
ncbi:MAG: LCP family protein [Ruminiclostridium sp.]|nr:LCP family protein [Ruminiclostridium sp.]